MLLQALAGGGSQSLSAPSYAPQAQMVNVPGSTLPGTALAATVSFIGTDAGMCGLACGLLTPLLHFGEHVCVGEQTGSACLGSSLLCASLFHQRHRPDGALLPVQI